MKSEFSDRLTIGRFHAAVREGDVVTVKELLPDVDCNEPDWDNSGRLALHEAVMRGSEELVRILLACEKCDPSVRNCQGENALHVALRSWPFDGHLVLLLIDAGCDTDAQALSSGLTPLHVLTRHAARAKSERERALVTDSLKAIVKRCDLNRRDARGETAIHHASFIAPEFTAPIVILAEAGADLNVRNDCGETALMKAVDYGFVEVVRLLVQKGACGNERNRYRQTALHYAANRNAHLAANILIDGGCDVNVTDLNGDSPLHIAAGKGFVSTVNRLLMAPAINVHLINDHSKRPLDVAIESGFPIVIQEIRKRKHNYPWPGFEPGSQRMPWMVSENGYFSRQIIQQHAERNASPGSTNDTSDEGVIYRHPEKLLSACNSNRKTAIHNGIINASPTNEGGDVIPTNGEC